VNPRISLLVGKQKRILQQLKKFIKFFHQNHVVEISVNFSVA
jgi:hypothetical protein